MRCSSVRENAAGSGLYKRLTDGTVQRTLLRFDQDELQTAGHGGVGTPAVFDHFVLDPRRPLIRHRFDVVMITRESDGRARIAELPQPEHGERTAAETAHLLARTALEIPAMADLDLLINQVRATSAVAR